MKKLKLDANQLEVEAFQVAPGDPQPKGTVVANDTISPFTAPCIYCDNQLETHTCNC